MVSRSTEPIGMVYAICCQGDLWHVCMVSEDLQPGDSCSDGVVMEVFEDPDKAYTTLEHWQLQ